MSVYSFLFIQVLSLSCWALVPTQEWILGGRTEVEGAPATHGVVSITESDGVEYCSGVLVARHAVLTAAHCVRGHSLVYLKNGGEVFAHSSVISVHPQYRPEDDDWTVRHSWDLAMVFFKQELPLRMRPVQLAGPADPLRVGDMLRISGYGNGSNSTLRPDTTRLRIMQLIPSGRSFLLDTRMDHGVCYGDSGGPAYRLVNQHVIVYGIVSHFVGVPNYSCTDNILFTDIRYFTAWMTQVFLARGAHPERNQGF